jgi:hypothetical protein
MDINDLKGRLEGIRAALADGDQEKAHVLEDSLHLDVLRTIANGDLSHTNVTVLAHIAASTAEWPFERHSA